MMEIDKRRRKMSHDTMFSPSTSFSMMSCQQVNLLLSRTHFIHEPHVRQHTYLLLKKSKQSRARIPQLEHACEQKELVSQQLPLHLSLLHLKQGCFESLQLIQQTKLVFDLQDLQVKPL